MIDLFREVETTQRHPKQKLDARHHGIAGANTHRFLS